MATAIDNGIPASTIGGAQDKYVAELIDGRYVPVPAPGPLRIASWPVVVRDPKAIEDFENEPGPPSIVDSIVARLRDR